MYHIYKLRANHVIDFAAEELKKYLRMMMPDCDDIDISYKPDARDGFRLGLMQDFDLCFSEIRDAFLDDVVHIDTDESGGILVGSNPRSVLFAVYRYLKENGCRWLYPGLDGEYIPVKNIAPIKYHHMADYRFRGQCNEGAEYQQCMLETIDFYAKLELNTYMIEFGIPFYYYDCYYSHLHNTKNRSSESVTPEQVLQWKRQCEVEISKRGLQFHDMGHGWTAEPFGLSSMNQWRPEVTEVSKEIEPYLAMVDGKRGLHGGVALNTNLCMSNPTVRTTFANSVANYAEKHQNASYIHVWLADGSRNHCECRECKKLRPSDYYVMIMNEIDEILTRKNLNNSRIVFLAYEDTLFAPKQEKIKNPERFALLYAPIQRSYTKSVCRENIVEPPEYKRNQWSTPKSAEENAAFLIDWQRSWNGTSFCYEYHYWKHLFYDPGNMYISRRIYEDILKLSDIGLEGIVEDGTQRAFFPNGFAMYVYAETLLKKNCDYEKVKEDYFSHAYGNDWHKVEKCLSKISELFDFGFMEGEKSQDLKTSKYYFPEHVADLERIAEVVKEERKLSRDNVACPSRVQTVSYRLLDYHAQYCEGLAKIMLQKAIGNEDKASELLDDFIHSFGVHEVYIERYYDHYLAMESMKVQK